MTTTEPVRATAALHHRDFRIFWIGAFISNTGNWMQRVTVPYVLWELTHSTLWVGASSFALLFPFLVTGPVGGSLADRFSRRRLLIVTNLVAAALAICLWLLWASGSTSPAQYVGLVALFGVAYGLYGPAWHALIPDLVPRSLLVNAITLDSAQINMAKALGPAVAGIVIAVAGPGGAFLLNAASFGAVLVALVILRAGRRPASVGRSRPLRDFLDSLRYIQERKGIAVCLAIVLALGLLGDPLVQFIVVFTDEIFHVGVVAYGVLGATFGLGAALVAPLVAGRGSSVRRSRMILASVVTYGLATAAFALAPRYGFALPAMLVAGGAWLAAASSLNTAIQLQVDDHMRGKVMALWLMVFGGAKPIGGLAQGWLAEHLGVRPTVAGAGVALVVVVVVFLLGFGSIRHIDHPGHAVAVTDPA